MVGQFDRTTVDSEIDLSTTNGNARVFINRDGYHQDFINSDRLSARLKVGKLGQGKRCCKCNGTPNVLVRETGAFLAHIRSSMVLSKRLVSLP